MAIYYLNVKSFSRSAGGRATSAAAYRSGERIQDERTGSVYNHAKRTDVLHKEILLPEKLAAAGEELDWARDRSRLWNAAEHAEVRSNARVAREYTVALPHELDGRRQIALARAFARELAERYGCAVDVAVHAPRHDPRNFHAHLLTTTREVTPDGLAEKTAIELSGTERTKRGLAGAADEFRNIRERWATLTNSALREASVSARVSHLRRDADTGLDRLERIQKDARSNWMQMRQQQVTSSRESHHERDGSRQIEVESDVPDQDLSF